MKLLSAMGLMILVILIVVLKLNMEWRLQNIGILPLQESEKHEKELEMTVQYAENNMKDLKHRIFNISFYVVTIMLVLLFLEVLREKLSHS